jgi:hypothetical protein
VTKAWQEFAEHGRMRPSAYYDHIVDVMEELVEFTVLTRDVATSQTLAWASSHYLPAMLAAPMARDLGVGPSTPHHRCDATPSPADSG